MHYVITIITVITIVSIIIIISAPECCNFVVICCHFVYYCCNCSFFCFFQSSLSLPVSGISIIIIISAPEWTIAKYLVWKPVSLVVSEFMLCFSLGFIFFITYCLGSFSLHPPEWTMAEYLLPTEFQ